MPDGLRLAAAGAQVGERRPSPAAGSLRLERERGARDDLARARGSSGGRRSRARSGARRSTPAAVQTSTHSSTRAELAAVGVGVHAHRAAHGAGDADAELDPRRGPARPRGPRPAAGGRRPRRGGGWPRALSRQGVRPTSRQVLRNPASATSRFDPEPTTPTSSPSSSAHAQQGLELLLLARPREPGGRAAGADRREPRQRVVALHVLGRRPRRSSGAPVRGGSTSVLRDGVDVAGAERHHQVARRASRPASTPTASSRVGSHHTSRPPAWSAAARPRARRSRPG